MNQKVRQFLIELARKGKTITYQGLSDECKLGLNMQESEFARGEIGRILGAISAYEFGHGRPLISSLVITKGDNYQGDGFYKLCEELGLGNWKRLKADMAFEVSQMKACYDYWKNDAHYQKYK